ncbi:MAG TPA: alpha/beta hydrolase [Streptosporangiaceae bacterium]|jgi:acetyl esterase
MTVDQATAALLAQLAGSGLKPLMEMTPQEARMVPTTNILVPGPQVARRYDSQVPTPDGSQFRVRVLIPAGDITALVVYYHGGGWVIDDIDTYDTVARTVANQLHAAVVNVDYRRAPEHRYPTAVRDAWTALQWAHERTAEIAGGHVPVIVMGDSAGGNLSAVVAQQARAAGGPTLAAQVLVYPVTDADLDNASYLDPANQLMLSRDAMIWFWGHYAPDPADRLRPDASPLRAESFAGLPPAIVLTAEHDPLRDEGAAYAERLSEAGVPVTYRQLDGQMHGFFPLLGLLPGAEDAIAYIAAELERLL